MTPIEGAPIGSDSSLALAEEGAVARELAPRVPSSLRIKLPLLALLGGVVAFMSLTTAFLVTRLFDELGPALRAHLTQKALRGAREVALAADVALALEDATLLEAAFDEILPDDDILAVIAVSPRGKLLAVRGALVAPMAEPFADEPDQIGGGDGFFTSWSDAKIEGSLVGRIAVGCAVDPGARPKRSEARRDDATSELRTGARRRPPNAPRSRGLRSVRCPSPWTGASLPA
jgi:hypothetical protein